MTYKRDKLFLNVAVLFAEQSTCERGHVGCVIVKGRRIISTGYNGAPTGMKHCTEVGCQLVELPGLPNAKDYAVTMGCQRAVHAELNAIAFAARHGVSTAGCVLYSTAAPCLKCAQAIVMAGFAVVVYGHPYRLPDGLDLLDAASIPVRQVSEDA